MSAGAGKNWRGGKSKNFAVTACSTTARRLQADYLSILNWGTVGKKYGVSGAMAYRVANGYEPKRPAIRLALGLPVTAPAPVCPIHGVPHTTKRCPQPKRRRDWLDWPVGELAALVREAVTPHG